MNCQHCQDTGEFGQLGFLDCGFCDAAVERGALNAAVKALDRNMTQEDLIWAVFKMGESSGIKKALDRAQ